MCIHPPPASTQTRHRRHRATASEQAHGLPLHPSSSTEATKPLPSTDVALPRTRAGRNTSAEQQPSMDAALYRTWVACAFATQCCVPPMPRWRRARGCCRRACLSWWDAETRHRDARPGPSIFPTLLAETLHDANDSLFCVITYAAGSSARNVVDVPTVGTGHLRKTGGFFPSFARPRSCPLSMTDSCLDENGDGPFRLANLMHHHHCYPSAVRCPHTPSIRLSSMHGHNAPRTAPDAGAISPTDDNDRIEKIEPTMQPGDVVVTHIHSSSQRQRLGPVSSPCVTLENRLKYQQDVERVWSQCLLELAYRAQCRCDPAATPSHFTDFRPKHPILRTATHPSPLELDILMVKITGEDEGAEGNGDGDAMGRKELTRALHIIAETWGSRVSKDVARDSKAEMTPEAAYRTLQVPEDVDEETLITLYKMQTGEDPEEALQIFHPEWRRSLNQLGDTCFLNYLLQIRLSICMTGNHSHSRSWCPQFFYTVNDLHDAPTHPNMDLKRH
ncbi:hypothetical protein K439DRAFT_1621061 [Ramaria rubella]|nr:hypothetical protein K439DRAFT_1621061 [Ramaria rubella]